MSTIAPLTVRPPWPDEVPRLATAYPSLLRVGPCHPLVLLAEAGGVERIVGAAGWHNPEAGVAGLALAVRSRFLADGSVSILLDAAAQAARAAGASRLLTIDDLPPADPRVAALERNGFSICERLEVWTTELARIRERVNRVQARMEATGRAHRFVAEPINEDHLPAVRALLAAERLLEGQQVTLAAEAGGRGYDRGLSFVIRSGAEIAGVILARPVGRGVVAIEAEAVAPGWRGGVANQVLFRACIEAAAARGVERYVYTVAPAARETRRMAQRSGGRLLGERVRLEKRLG